MSMSNMEKRHRNKIIIIIIIIVQSAKSEKGDQFIMWYWMRRQPRHSNFLHFSSVLV